MKDMSPLMSRPKMEDMMDPPWYKMGVTKDLTLSDPMVYHVALGNDTPQFQIGCLAPDLKPDQWSHR